MTRSITTEHSGAVRVGTNVVPIKRLAKQRTDLELALELSRVVRDLAREERVRRCGGESDGRAEDAAESGE